MNSSISLTELKCKKKGHNQSPFVAMCIDLNCRETIKIICINCIFQSHQQHKIVKLNEIENLFKEDFSKEIHLEENDKEIKQIIEKEEKKVRNFLEDIKEIVDEMFTIRVNDFIFEFKQKILSANILNENHAINPLINSELYPVTSILQLQKLSNFLIKYYEDNIIAHKKEVDEKKEKKEENLAIKEIKNFDNEFKKFCESQSELIRNFMKNEFLKQKENDNERIDEYFEWSNKTFGSYGFLYEIGDKGRKATKITTDGTITIIRAKDQLNLEQDYYIEFELMCPKMGDFDIGFGKDAVGISCWTRTSGAYGITNLGLYENGKLTRRDIKIKDKDVIGLEIYLKEKKNCKVKKEGNVIYEFPIEIDELFPMCAIRKVGNSILVRKFAIIA